MRRIPILLFRAGGVLALIMLASSACAPRAPRPVANPVADLERMVAESWEVAQGRQSQRTPGSLWQDGGLGDSLIADTRAARLDDLVTIRIVENTEGENGADTALVRNATNDWGVSQLFGVQDKVRGKVLSGFDLADVFRSDRQKNFQGEGSTSRASSLETTVTARVFQVFPNGTLAVVGRKGVTINHEQQMLWLAGLVRPEDIQADNSVVSTRLAELSLFLTGEGDVDNQLREGWMARWLTKVWPF